VSEVFIHELAAMQSYGAVGKLTPHHQEITSCLETVLSAMKMFTGVSPLISTLSESFCFASSTLTSIFFVV
jgi:hypothetical protein